MSCSGVFSYVYECSRLFESVGFAAILVSPVLEETLAEAASQ